VRHEEFYLLGYNAVSPLKSTGVSEEHVASIFGHEEKAKQETIVKEDGKRAPKRRLTSNGIHSVISAKIEPSLGIN
jgi:hypothetical protein